MEEKEITTLSEDASQEEVKPAVVKTTIGFVGESMLHTLCAELAEKNPDAWEVVILPTKKKSKVSKKRVFKSDIVFISSVCCDDAESIVKEIRELRKDNPVIIRGDVPVGTTAKLEREHGLVMFNPDNTSPEMSDEDKRAQISAESFQILGLIEAESDKVQLIAELFTALTNNRLWASKNVAFVQSSAAELTRLATMSLLSIKNAFFDEIGVLASKFDVDPNFLKNIVSINSGMGQTSIDVAAHKSSLHKIFVNLEKACEEKGLDPKLHKLAHDLSGCKE